EPDPRLRPDLDPRTDDQRLLVGRARERAVATDPVRVAEVGEGHREVARAEPEVDRPRGLHVRDGLLDAGQLEVRHAADAEREAAPTGVAGEVAEPDRLVGVADR